MHIAVFLLPAAAVDSHIAVFLLPVAAVVAIIGLHLLPAAAIGLQAALPAAGSKRINGSIYRSEKIIELRGEAILPSR